MSRPFVAYLRVYEPLSSFDQPLAARLSARLAAGPLIRIAMGERERELWLRSQIAVPSRLLPGEQSDGRPSPRAPLDVLVLDPAEVPPSPTATVGEGPLVCPLDLRPRAAAALVGFLATSDAVLSEATLAGPGRTVDAARNHAAEVMSQLAGGSVHVISSTWTVPLPWFALVEPAERQLVLGSADGRREVFWRSPMADVRRRTARAHAVVKDTIGEDGPAGILRDTGRWLENFHPHSVVELDYGGLVQLLDEDELRADTSAQDVHAIVDAMAAGKVEEVGVLYERLSEFWGGLAARERAN